MRSLLLMMIAGGCNSSPDCETVEFEVQDDEADLGAFDFTVAELLEGISGVRTLPASDYTGQPIAVELRVGRGEGKASFRDTTREEGPRSPFGHNDMGWVCEEDTLVVPIVYELATSDGALAAAGAALAHATNGYEPSEPARLVQVTDTIEGEGGLEGAELSIQFWNDDVDHLFLGSVEGELGYPPAAAGETAR